MSLELVLIGEGKQLARDGSWRRCMRNDFALSPSVAVPCGKRRNHEMFRDQPG